MLTEAPWIDVGVRGEGEGEGEEILTSLIRSVDTGSWSAGRAKLRGIAYVEGGQIRGYRRFYDLGRVNYWGPQSKRGIKFGFDETRQRPAESPVAWRAKYNSKVRGEERARIMACGGGDQPLSDEEIQARTVARNPLQEEIAPVQ